MSLSKGNALAIKRYNGSPDKGAGSKSWLSDKIKGYKNYGPIEMSFLIWFIHLSVIIKNFIFNIILLFS